MIFGGSFFFVLVQLFGSATLVLTIFGTIFVV